MRNYLWRLLLAACCCCSWLGLTGVKAKPLVSLGLGIQSHRTYQSPYAETYYDGGYHPYHPGNLYPEYPAYPAGYPAYPAYPYYHPAAPYAPGNRYGALDIGIGALSLTPFLL